MQNPAHIITEKAKEIALDLLPAKRKKMLNYLDEKSQEVKPSTLWSKYSMIKAVLSVKENIEINRVIAFLKRNSVGYEPTKSKVLTRQEIDTFLTNADDMKYEIYINKGHCFRRSSASLAADSDVDLISLKRLGGWKSSSVAE
ncbi:hypothetical protein Zmor_001287 [Zophobas morio]|uniref:Uncharacterized protein n=1 Tax=Zophobas morio TaxID=2755281 RepID=A0AA38J4Z9_9CUCU|nr:hypothetical protein Zmor_001287 [Zophobas morio]